MRHAYRAIALLGALLLCACGGGSSSSSSSPSSSNSGSHNFSGGGSNVVAITVGNGPAGVTDAAFNIPYATVTVCVPNSNTCATINNVLVDTGSSGLRLIASVLRSSGLTLSPMVNPGNAADTIHECLPFADGYTWGWVSTAMVKIGGESASAVPVQVIDDSPSPSPMAPGSCTENGTGLNSVEAFDANGVLGIGLFDQDCGSSCAASPVNIYYSCTVANDCLASTLPLEDQVSNPVASFATDNNGVIVQLPAIGTAGASTANGYLVFGIGTESNNALDGASVLTTDAAGNITTTFNGQAIGTGFFDSGSNALFFPDSSIGLCGTTGGAADFYCPSSTLNLSATNEGQNGTMSTVNFQVANLNDLSGNNFALDDAAGPTSSISGVGQSYFDFGLPFFYGNTVFIAIDGIVASGVPGPYYAY